MGICIGYSGNIDDVSRIDALIEFARDYASAFHWKTLLTDETSCGLLLRRTSKKKGEKGGVLLFEERVRGIYLQPPNTESVALLFNTKGKLTHYSEVPIQMLSGPGLDPTATYFVESGNWVKVTGEVESHKRIVKLLDVLKSKFIGNLKVSDDTGYWKHRNNSKLLMAHGQMSIMVRMLGNPGFAKRLLEASGEKIEGELIPLDPKLPLKPPKPRKRAAHRVN
ncbi:MAG: hypothetical protein HYZ37_14930 [Candidatus Solibacter usitatus]|nr:hypothetical protein [Candidatus Solibacter usitatus]